MFIDDLRPWDIEKIKCFQECPAKFWLLYVSESRDFLKKENFIVQTLTKILNKAIILMDRNYIRQGLSNAALSLLEFNKDAASLEVGLLNLYDRIQNLLRKLPDAKIIPMVKFGVDFDFNCYDWFDERALFRTSFDIVIEHSLVYSTRRRKAFRVIDFFQGKIYNQAVEEYISVKAACLKYATKWKYHKLDYQLAVVTDNTTDIVLTPIKSKQLKYYKTSAVRDFLLEGIKNIPADLNQLMDQRKNSTSRSCKTCAYQNYCH